MKRILKILLSTFGYFVYSIVIISLILFTIYINYIEIDLLDMSNCVILSSVAYLLILIMTIVICKNLDSFRIKNILKNFSTIIFVISYFILINNCISCLGSEVRVSNSYYVLNYIFLIPIAIIIPICIKVFRNTIPFEIFSVFLIGLSMGFQVIRINKINVINYVVCFIITTIVYYIAFNIKKINDKYIKIFDKLDCEDFEKKVEKKFEKKFDNKVTYIQYVMKKVKENNTYNNDKTYEFMKVPLKNSRHRYVYDNFRVFACSNINNIYIICLPNGEYIMENKYPFSTVGKIKFIYDAEQFRIKAFKKAKYIMSKEFDDEITNILNKETLSNRYLINKLNFPIILKETRSEIQVRYSTDFTGNMNDIIISKNYNNFNKLYNIIKNSTEKYKQYLLEKEV